MKTVVIARPGGAVHVEAIDRTKVIFIEMESDDISSTSVREAMARGEALDQLCPPAVVTYLREQGIGKQ